jgi:hypothetical protein
MCGGYSFKSPSRNPVLIMDNYTFNGATSHRATAVTIDQTLGKLRSPLYRLATELSLDILLDIHIARALLFAPHTRNRFL